MPNGSKYTQNGIYFVPSGDVLSNFLIDFVMKRIFSTILVSVIAGGLTAYAVMRLAPAPQMRADGPAVAEYAGNGTDGNRERHVGRSDGTSSLPDFTYAAESAVKAVVHVKVVKHENQPVTLYDFFFGYGQGQQRAIMGAGSGVIISEDGYIVTNNHVIEGADNIQVVLNDNRTYRAKIVGADPVTDVALLKIEETGLPVIPFGDSDALRLGEWVLAIGNPYNLTSTVTAGIVSAKARSMPNYSGEFRIEAFIQTDAAVNPGNSGGALVDTDGNLVGINTMIASRTGSYSGYSFAVPVSIVRKVTDDLRRFGEVRRAMLGISMLEIDKTVMDEFGLKDSEGAFVYKVYSGSPARKAGIKGGDVIVALDGVKVRKPAEVIERMSLASPGDSIVVTVVRNGDRMDMTVSI